MSIRIYSIFVTKRLQTLGKLNFCLTRSLSTKMANFEQYLHKKIIVIGAGMSGLACASHLKDFGFKNVLILEAKNRIGGRTLTINEEESSDLSKEPACNFIEMGAQWIHGIEGNAIYELAHSKGLLDESAPDYFDALSDYSLNNTAEECQAIKTLIEFLDEKIETCSDSLNEDISVLEFLNREFSNYIQPHIDMIELLKGVLDLYCNLHCELSGCTSLSSLSLRLLNQYKECEGSQTVELKYGFSSILNLLHEKIPDDTILRNAEVKKIDWTNLKNQESSENKVKKSELKCNCSQNLNGPKVKVFCNNGEEYDVDHVIITMPLGYLKNNLDSIFVPSLPQEKITAIQSVGFGTVNKIFLEFSEPFWQPTTIYHVMWTSSLYEIFGEELDEVSTQWLFYINRFAYSPHHPNMLCAWIVGEGAIDVEKIPEDEVSIACMTLLERIVGNELPKPLRIIRSTWHSDPHTNGSYSYLSMESTEDSNLQIAEPLFSDICSSKHLVLQFAGEATHPTHFSTVHGAYETGRREAQRLFDHYRLNNALCTNQIYNNLKVVVIGAGIAGLAAAHSLFKMGFSQVILLEAQEKIGGRIFSLFLDDYILELGAQWLHGTDNPLYDISVHHNLLCDPSDEPSYEGKGIFCACNGNIIEKTVVDDINIFLEDIRMQLNEGQYDSSFVNKSAQFFFSQAFDKYIAKYNDSLNPIRKGLFDWFLKFEIIDNACDSLDQVALQCYSEWCNISEDVYHINFVHGFSSVIETIKSQMPPGYLYLQKPVKCINWQKCASPPQIATLQNHTSKSFPVLLECEDGEEINADFVILTASMGYIKENMNTFFKPTLPEHKSRAFSNIGFGTINKIYLIFENPFWNINDEGFQLIWTCNLDEECKMLLKENPWINGITGFDIVRKQPNVLLGWIGGTEAKLVENVDEGTIAIICVKLLRKFLKRPNIPYPIKTIRSCWHNNNYVKGSYSFRSLKFYESNSTIEDLQSPLLSTYLTSCGEKVQWPVLFFAGEAMDETSFSSVHGAYQSGLKAANDIKSLCSKFLEFN